MIGNHRKPRMVRFSFQQNTKALWLKVKVSLSVQTQAKSYCRLELKPADSSTTRHMDPWSALSLKKETLYGSRSVELLVKCRILFKSTFLSQTSLFAKSRLFASPHTCTVLYRWNPLIHHSCSTVNTINPNNCVMLTLGFVHFLTDCR